VIGNHEGSFEEELELLNNQPSVAFREEIMKGTAQLNQLIEKAIAVHLDNQVPIARKLLESELNKINVRLEIIKEEEPLTIV